MSEAPRVVDAADARLDDYRNLRERDLAGTRSAEGVFVGESLLIVEQMLARPFVTRSVLASERMAMRAAELIAASASPNTPLIVASDEIIESLAGFHVHRGVLAIGVRAPFEHLDPLSPAFVDAPLLLALDGVNNMDNVGALFRAAAAFGVGGALLSRASHDPLYRKSIRVSMGHALRVPFAWCDDLAATLAAHAQRADRVTVAADSSTDAQEIDAWLARRDPTRPISVVIGGEYHGVSAAVRACCDARVRIPMAMGVDSLNAAVAASILLHRLSTRA